MLFRFERSVSELKQVMDTAECDKDVLNSSTEKKNSRINSLSKMLLLYKDDVKRKDEEILTVGEPEKLLETQRSAFKASIEELEMTTQQLIMENQEKRNLTEKVISKIHNVNFYYCYLCINFKYKIVIF